MLCSWPRTNQPGLPFYRRWAHWVTARWQNRHHTPNPAQMAGDAAEMRLAIYDLHRMQANLAQQRENLEQEVTRQRNEVNSLTFICRNCKHKTH